MDLHELLRRAGLDATVPVGGIEIAGVTDHSKRVAPGWLFVAVPGVAADGHAFIADAVRNGAAALVGSRPRPAEAGAVPYVQVAQPRRALSRLLHAFFGFPMSDLLVIGVTGTNGKSTTVYLIESILRAAGKRPGLIGTIEYRFADAAAMAGSTTPHPAVLLEYVRDMKQAGMNALAMEVSSHALEQDRVECIPFRAAVLTNVTHDHLDYHRSREAYIEAKWKFFDNFLRRSPRGMAVFNLDDPVGREFHRRYDGPALTYGSDTAADVHPRILAGDRKGLHLQIKTPAGACTLRSRLLGDYNVANILAAVTAGLAAALPLSAIVEGVENLAGVPGRFERVETGAPFDVYVDFAHTPDALDCVLASARRLVGSGRLICVFGAGGDRDPTKREPMGAAVARHADRAIITKDNSRTEDPRRIAAALAAGIEGAALRRCARYDIILDRGEAIRTALGEARPGDIVVVAGKGHELYEHEAGQVRPWDDRQVIRDVLSGKR